MNKEIAIGAVIVIAVIAASILYLRINMQYPTGDNSSRLYGGIIDACETLCEQRLNENQNLSSGPCLSNEIAADWVCDVAHNPRQAIDNLPENQCSAFGKTARHFVEVDENCKLIRTV